MIAAALAMAALQPLDPRRFESSWSSHYWVANGRFSECYDREMERVLTRRMTAQSMLDEVMAACRRQWEGRVRELRTDLRNLHPDWSDQTLSEYLNRVQSEFYETRLDRLRRRTGETPTPNIQ